VDAVPDKELSGRVAAISPLAKPDFSSWPVQKNFDLAVQLNQGDPRLRPGMSANARIAVDRLPNSILIPLEAIFSKNGRSMVYVLSGAKFQERAVELGRRNATQAVVLKGLRAGERVALRDPTLKEEAEGK
jgi:multidrug efflux pump subunit AcrA (membrane-fusion protein)